VQPKLKQIGLTTVLIVVSAAGAVLGGIENQSWWILAASGAAGVVIQSLTSKTTGGTPALGTAAKEAPLLRQLPATLPDFVGRADELGRLRERPSEQSESAPDIRVVFGPGGVGKTSLVVHAVALDAGRFPDGQLYVDLQGQSLSPLRPEDVLGGWLRDLGVDERLIPVSLTERSREFRSLMAGKRAAVILDNAEGEHQVRPLLIGGAGCTTYITSRSTLGGLAAVRRIQLDGFSAEESLELLSKIIGGERVDAERQPASELANASGGLPLALRVLAGRLVSEPRPISFLTSRLERRRTEGKLLTEFTFGDLSVEASLALSREHLSSQTQEAFDTLGLHPAVEWSDWSAAALCGLSVGDAQAVLDDLRAAQLVKIATVTPSGEARFRMHDLVREFAKAQAIDRITEPDRASAFGRLASAYLSMTELADAEIHPAGSRHRGRTGSPRCRLDPDAARRPAESPFRWIHLEREGIASVVAACHRAKHWSYCWEIADAASVGFENLRLWDIGLRVAELSLDAAERMQSDAARAATLRNCGEIDREMGEHDRAVDRLEESVRLFRKVKDPTGIIDAGCNLALVHMRWGSPAAAEVILRSSLNEARASFDVRGEAWILEILGECAIIRGNRESGVRDLEGAAQLFGSSDERRGEAFAVSNAALLIIDDIGWMPTPSLDKRGPSTIDPAEATSVTGLLDRAEASFRTLGDERNLALVAVARIRMLILQRREREAREAVRRAQSLEGFEHDWRLRGLLLHCDGVLDHRSGSVKNALAKYLQALELVEPFGDRLTLASITLNLGMLRRRRSDQRAEARVTIEAARALFQSIGRHEDARFCDTLLR
jgi:tetratricopeptide (TPR) repeat protein